ncbi:hypothetical protein [Nocardia sp. NPDC050406]|uniref:hypothetical protein n=1 Tax=Nocardia sp. NPDC050406 TaxID=3364318 RepID=UPI0037A716A5
MRILFAVATLALIAACTNDKPTPSVDLTYDDAERVVVENFTAVWPVRPTVTTSRGPGCGTNAAGMSEGPPWAAIMSEDVYNPSQEFIDKTLANLEAMTAHGFSRRPDAVPGDDPVNRSYEDERGFSIAVGRYAGASPDGVKFGVTAKGPCIDE